jgi:hypothetical protein
VNRTVATRILRFGSLVGPASFVTAWALAGAVTDRTYSPVRDTISRLAAVGADTRPLMTTGMIAFGVALPASAVAWKATLGGRAWILVAATGISTLAVAATPLDHSELVDRLHEVAAAAGYITLAAIPLAARTGLISRGFARHAAVGTALSIVSAASLVVSLAVEQTGLFQRLGLTVIDLWLVASVPVLGTLVERRDH